MVGVLSSAPVALGLDTSMCNCRSSPSACRIRTESYSADISILEEVGCNAELRLLYNPLWLTEDVVRGPSASLADWLETVL